MTIRCQASRRAKFFRHQIHGNTSAPGARATRYLLYTPTFNPQQHITSPRRQQHWRHLYGVPITRHNRYPTRESKLVTRLDDKQKKVESSLETTFRRSRESAAGLTCESLGIAPSATSDSAILIRPRVESENQRFQACSTTAPQWLTPVTIMSSRGIASEGVR